MSRSVRHLPHESVAELFLFNPLVVQAHVSHAVIWPWPTCSCRGSGVCEQWNGHRTIWGEGADPIARHARLQKRTILAPRHRCHPRYVPLNGCDACSFSVLHRSPLICTTRFCVVTVSRCLPIVLSLYNHCLCTRQYASASTYFLLHCHRLVRVGYGRPLCVLPTSTPPR